MSRLIGDFSDDLLIPRKHFNIRVYFIRPIGEADHGDVNNITDKTIGASLQQLMTIGLPLEEGRIIIPPSNFAMIEINEVGVGDGAVEEIPATEVN